MFVLDAGVSGTQGNSRSHLRLEPPPDSKLCTGPFDIHTFKPHYVPAKEVVSHFTSEGKRTNGFPGVTKVQVRDSDLHLQSMGPGWKGTSGNPDIVDTAVFGMEPVPPGHIRGPRCQVAA